MTIFSHEDLQHIIEENYAVGVMNKAQVEKLVNEVNAGTEQSISFEWEIVILNVLSKVGTVIHEKEFGKKKPDVFFDYRQQQNQSFIADIVTVSDEGHQNDNPVDTFNLELERILQRHGLSIYQFTVHINSFPKPFPSHTRTKLKIPRPEKLHQEFFNTEFKNLIKSIVENQNSPSSYSVKTEEIDIVVEYNPYQNEFKMHLPAFDVHPPLRQNPFLNAIKGKARKLKKAEYKGTRGIILCDGGSTMFLFRRSDAISYGSEKVIEDFLRDSSSISFLLVVFVEILYAPYPVRNGYKVTTELYLNEKVSNLSNELRDTLNSLEQFFPTPTIDVRSAISNIKRGKLIEIESTVQLKLPQDTALNSSNDNAQGSNVPLIPALRKWVSPIKKKQFRRYSSKLVLDIVATQE